MLLNFAITTVINGIALWVAAWAVPGITFGDNMSTSTTIWTVAIVALIFVLVNALVRPIAALLSLPFIILTLGLFIFILNAAMLQLTSWLAGKFDLAFHVNEFFWDAIWGALIITFVSLLLGFLRTDD
ncbi:MAG TPA: phage holin family protein [Humibacillus sp.]|nr:phage holin family protein [Humibacillus sp.]